MTAPSGGKSGLLEEVRRSCAAVAERAAAVAIVPERIPAFAGLLLKEESPGFEMDPALHHLGRGEESVAFFITLDAVNFGSGYFPEILSDPSLSGYKTIAASLSARFRERGAIAPESLAHTTPEEAAALFDLDLRRPLAAELASLFARSWQDLGRFVLRRFGGSFSALVEEAGGEARRLVALLTEMPLYRDVARYEALPVSFYKRAQITAADLFIAFGGEGAGRFDDIDELTLFADNLVPHVLRHDGVLRYDSGLAGRIDAGEPLPAGSPEEVEIRGCAVTAVEMIVAEMRRLVPAVNALRVDNRLWHRGQLPRYRLLPRHRTRTPYY